MGCAGTGFVRRSWRWLRRPGSAPGTLLRVRRDRDGHARLAVSWTSGSVIRGRTRRGRISGSCPQPAWRGGAPRPGALTRCRLTRSPCSYTTIGRAWLACGRAHAAGFVASGGGTIGCIRTTGRRIAFVAVDSAHAALTCSSSKEGSRAGTSVATHREGLVGRSSTSLVGAEIRTRTRRGQARDAVSAGPTRNKSQCPSTVDASGRWSPGLELGWVSAWLPTSANGTTKPEPDRPFMAGPLTPVQLLGRSAPRPSCPRPSPTRA
jgi:hypothetical protein